MGLRATRRSGLALALALALPCQAWAQYAGPVVASVSPSGSLTGGSSDIDIAAPTGVAAGDLLVACIGGVITTDTTDVSASGWTHVNTTNDAGRKLGLLWKAWDSGDPSTYTFTLAAGTVSTRRGLIWRITGADTTAPSNATSSAGGASSTARTYASITTGTAYSLALGCVMWATSDVTYTPHASLSNDVIQQRMAGDHLAITAAGVTTSALAGTGGNTSWLTLFWAVADAPAATGGTKRCTLLGVC